MQIQSFVLSRGHRLALAVSLAIGAVSSVSAATLDRIKETGHIKLGYVADARPFTHSTAGGTAQGFTVELCQQVADQVKAQLGLAQLTVDWVAVTPASHIADVKEGKVDLLCTPTSETAAKRQDVAYSKPVFPGGVRAVVRRDTGAALRQALGGESPKPRATWRGSPAASVLNNGKFGVMAGTTTERWLASKMTTLKVTGTAVPFPDYATGLQALMDSKVDVFFGDRAVAVGAVDLGPASAKLEILPRAFTNEPLSLALPRNDDDFRLVVDRALSASYATPAFKDSYSKWAGTMDDSTQMFYQWVSFAP